MRIISGQARGRRLKMPRGEVRPSTDRLREALFSILSTRTQEAAVLDLFAGTGALGLESLSRGAVSAVFVESDKYVARTTQENVALCKLGGRVVTGDAIDFAAHDSGTYDLIFADPPYAKAQGDRDFPSELLSTANVAKMLADDGLLIMEVFKDASLPDSGEFDLIDDRSYGVCRILFYQKKDS